MAARALWKGAISFSLVNIPVALYPASRAQSIDLDLLDKRDFAPVGFRRYNKNTGKEVEWKNIVKGFQHRKGAYVVLTDEDFRRANVKATQTIDIQQFVAADDIPPYFFETPYFVVPDGKSARVYRLLHTVLEKHRRAAIATVVIRTRQWIAALIPVGDMLVLNTMRYASELLPAIAIESGSGTKPSAKELQMAERLVAGMSGKWKPERFHDSYIDDLKKRIAEKVKARQTRALTAPEPKKRVKTGDDSEVVDLMALLEQSLTKRKPARATKRAAPRRARKRAA